MSLPLAVLLLALPAILAQYEPNTVAPRVVYVHLFEWNWDDVAAECERFLGPKGFGAIQLSPAHEHAVDDGAEWRPWHQRYRPVSFNLNSRSGNEQQYRDMVRRCNNAGVRIYQDVVFNHMSPGCGTGSGGSEYCDRRYPGVPFGPNDFTPRSACPSWNGDITTYGDAEIVRNCNLLGMPDLAIYQPYVRDKIVAYLDKLVEIGVAGFRVDASKHMWPSHLEEIFSRVRDLNTQFFPQGGRPYIFHEIIDNGGEPITAAEYLGSGRVQEFKYGKHLSRVVLKQGGEQMKYLRNWGEAWGLVNGMLAVSFIDNHDNQRGHGGGGDILTFRRSREYKIANAFMLAHPYGVPQIMSSYAFTEHWQGPPSDSQGNTNTVPINADGSCGGGWICEHRWRQITNMVRFRNVAGNGAVVHWWDNGANQIAFGRGQTGRTTAFIVINNDNYGLATALQTGLPDGTYCDIISGDKVDGRCTGRSINISGGNGHFTVPNDSDPVFAIHLESKL